MAGITDDTLQQRLVLLVLFDANGDTIFTKDLGVEGEEWRSFSVKRTQDGGFILVGQTDATGYLDGFAIKTDALGNEQWRRTYGQPAPQTDGLIAVWEMNNGDLVMGGAKYPTTTTFQRWVQRTDPVGNVLWELMWPAIDRGAGAYIEPLANGDCLMASNWSFAPNFQVQRFHLARIDMSSGTVLWDKLYADAHPFQALFAAKETPTGDLIACGVSEESGFMQGVLLRTTAQGDSIWMRKYWYQDSIYTQGTGQFYDVLPTPDGGFIATGPCYRYQPVQPNFPPGYSQDAWVVKVDADGCIVPGCNSVGISEQATNLLDALRIWPNPVASGQPITVQLDLPPSLHGLPLTTTLVSADGKVVWQQALGAVVGQTTFNLQPPQLSAGMYYVHVASEGKWLTGGKFMVQ